MRQLKGQVLKKVLKQRGPAVAPILRDRKGGEKGGKREKREERNGDWRERFSGVE